MVESPFYFFQVEVEIVPRDPTIMVDPMFRRGPESFNSIEMVSASRFSRVFSDYHMVSADIQKCVRVPIIRVGEAACLCVVYHERD